jgi:sugar (pentulose or hexulose) kinase
MVQLTTTVEPDPSTRQAYDEGYIRYRETYAALAPLFRRVEMVAHGPV